MAPIRPCENRSKGTDWSSAIHVMVIQCAVGFLEVRDRTPSLVVYMNMDPICLRLRHVGAVGGPKPLRWHVHSVRTARPHFDPTFQKSLEGGAGRAVREG